MSGACVLGIDVGPTRCGWALLAPTTRQGRARFLDGGMVDSDLKSLLAFLKRYGIDGVTLAIEEPSGYIHEHKRGAQLLETRGVSGAIGMAAKMLGVSVVRMTAQQVRGSMCRGGRGMAGDDAVKRACALYVAEMPKRSSTHVRDAILIACCVLFNAGRIAKAV